MMTFLAIIFAPLIGIGVSTLLIVYFFLQIISVIVSDLYTTIQELLSMTEGLIKEVDTIVSV